MKKHCLKNNVKILFFSLKTINNIMMTGSTSGGVDHNVKKCKEIFLSTDELKKPFFRDLFYALGDTKVKFVNTI